jgi:hypothetical protein
VIVPEIVERRRHHFLLHSHRPALPKAYLLRAGSRVIVVRAPRHPRDDDEDDGE